VVTGATNGIGRATAIGLARLGARIVILARNPAKAASVVAEIAAIAGAVRAEIVVADLTEMKQVRHAAEDIAARFERVDVPVCNAGECSIASISRVKASNTPMRSATFQCSY
jgi:NAD(P)-dependent dehydrogenase (short-subunit alcohol dehydrogenase family)